MTPKEFSKQTGTIENFPYKTDDRILKMAICVGRIEQLQNEQERDLAYINSLHLECEHDFTDADECLKCTLPLPF